MRPVRAFWRARPRWPVLALMAALGAGVAAGQAPLGWWWLALPALARALWRLSRAASAPGAIWAGWFLGAGYFAAAMFWIVEPFMVDADRYGWMAPFALVFMAFGMALFWAAGAGIGTKLGGHSRAARVAGAALGIGAGEAIRSYVLTGFPWALIGHVWFDTPVAQISAWCGPIGLTLATLAVAALPGLGATRRMQAAGAATACALIAAGWGAGAMRLAPTGEIRADAPVIRLVQPNAAQKLKWRGDMERVFFERQLSFTAMAGSSPPDLIVWPETAVPWLLNRPGPVLDLIAEAAGGVPVALGIQRTEGARAFNSLAVIGPDAGVRAIYDKHHLVPFGEYIPGGDLMPAFGITAFAAREGNGYSAGSGAAVIDLGPDLGRVLPLICYEAVFPQDIRAAPARPDWILQVTNDAWFGSLSGPYQHLAQARLRAIEQGLPLVRVANTGVSAVIDAKGRVLAEIPLDTDGAVDAALPVALPATIYARSGDWPAFAALLVAFAALFLARRANPVDRSTDEA